MYSLAELKAAVANASIPMIDVIGEHVFLAGDEITVPEGRTVTIFSTGSAVLTGGGAGASRFFSVEGALTLESLSLLGGVAADGGAVLVEPTGSLTVVSCTMSYNRAVTKSIPLPTMPKSTIVQDYGYGGAIFSKGTLVVEHSKFAGNNGIGGAIAVGDPTLPEASGSAAITNTAFEANKSPHSQAGALANFASTDVTRCMFSANYAFTVGGALYSSNPKGGEAAKLVVTGSSFSANKVDAHETKIKNTQDVYVKSGSSIGDADWCVCGFGQLSACPRCPMCPSRPRARLCLHGPGSALGVVLWSHLALPPTPPRQRRMRGHTESRRPTSFGQVHEYERGQYGQGRRALLPVQRRAG